MDKCLCICTFFGAVMRERQRNGMLKYLQFMKKLIYKRKVLAKDSLGFEESAD